MHVTNAQFQKRIAALAAIIVLPLLYLLLLRGPIPQDAAYHFLADARTCLGINNFGNVVSNLAFLLVGMAAWLWCRKHLHSGARLSWTVFFIGVALVFCGSSYYHWSPNDDTLVWDRLPMTVAFMGLFAALVSEHLGQQFERHVLIPALVLGAASVFWWRHTGDLRVYAWVQAASLLAIPFVLAMFPARYTHRVYLLYGLGFYALAKVAEGYDEKLYTLTSSFISGHTLKHLLAALAPLMLLWMLQRRQAVASNT
jgi:uncharacterized membrane protein YidH (DUF202 family)